MWRSTGVGLATIALVGCASTLVKYGLEQPDPAYLETRPGFSWSRAETERLRVYAETGTEAVPPAQALTAPLELVLAEVSSALGGATPSGPVHVFAVASPERVNALMGVRTPGRAFHATRVFAFQVRPGWEATARHELTHVVAANAWSPAKEDWFNEGFATYVSRPQIEGGLHGYVRQVILPKPDAPSLAELAGRMQRNERTGELYIQGASVAKHLQDRYGLDAVRQVWRGGLAAIPAATGKDLAAFEAEWRAAVQASGG